MISKEQIEKINKACPSGQGIFIQPNGIPTSIKEPVIYTSYLSGGVTGGSCWGSDTRPFVTDDQDNEWEVLDITLSEIYPEISYLNYKKILKLVNTESYRDSDYYGNYDEYKIKFILLSEFEKLIEKLNQGT